MVPSQEVNELTGTGTGTLKTYRYHNLQVPPQLTGTTTTYRYNHNLQVPQKPTKDYKLQLTQDQTYIRLT